MYPYAHPPPPAPRPSKPLPPWVYAVIVLWGVGALGFALVQEHQTEQKRRYVESLVDPPPVAKATATAEPSATVEDNAPADDPPYYATPQVGQVMTIRVNGFLFDSKESVKAAARAAARKADGPMSFIEVAVKHGTPIDAGEHVTVVATSFTGDYVEVRSKDTWRRGWTPKGLLRSGL